MKNIALGQYYPAESPMHRLDPRIKVVLALIYICAAAFCKNIIAFAVLLLSALLIVALGKIPFKTIFRSLVPVLFVMLFAVFFQVFFTRGDMLLFEWWKIRIYGEGLYLALFTIVRIFTLIIGTSMFLTYTTTPIELTYAIEDLLSPLKKLKVPVHDFAMMMTLALRFIPTLVEEADKIMTAQKARGADFSTGSLVQRAKALKPVLIPLIVSAMRHAVELAVAMECRCYHGDGTRMVVRKCRFSDFAALAVMILFFAGIICLNIFGIGYTA